METLVSRLVESHTPASLARLFLTPKRMEEWMQQETDEQLQRRYTRDRQAFLEAAFDCIPPPLQRKIAREVIRLV